jgi:capsular polysaccharide export protein
VSDQLLPAFFANPSRPDCAAYRDYRQFLLETSQVPGGYYSASGRKQLLRQVVDMMLRSNDPYRAIMGGNAPSGARLRVVNKGPLA